MPYEVLATYGNDVVSISIDGKQRNFQGPSIQQAIELAKEKRAVDTTLDFWTFLGSNLDLSETQEVFDLSKRS